MKIAIILGTRPEIIKMSPLIKECIRKKLNFFILHTNQHYTENLDKIFFKELYLPEPKYNLGIGSGTHGLQTGKMIIEIEKILLEEKPEVVLVQGDTNTVLAGALTASKLHIKIAHIEAGLRSYDRNMPEEINRIITDHISDYLFVPTKIQREILINEGIDKNKIYIVGNTIVDAVYQNIKLAVKNQKLINSLGLEKKKYFLVTIHRAENVDYFEKLAQILKSFELIYSKYKFPLFFPIHPRTKKMIDKWNIRIPNGTILHEPIGYLEFLYLLKNAKVVLTDSGGIQEEACILHIPCVTLRENTERPETIKVGANVLAGTNPKKILISLEKMFRKKRNWKNPFGDGKAGQKIVKIIKENE